MALSLLTWAVLVAAAVVVGELVYRQWGGTTSVIGDAWQGLAATLYFLIAAGLIIGGGKWALIGFVMVVVFFAIARSKFAEVREADLRRRLKGG